MTTRSNIDNNFLIFFIYFFYDLEESQTFKYHTEVSVANLGINLATTKYIFLLKKEGFFMSIY